MRKSGAKLLSWLGRMIDRWWYLPFITVLAGAEIFVSVLAMEFILISSTLLRPHRRNVVALALSFGSGLGAAAVGIVLHQFAPGFLIRLSHPDPASESWRWFQQFVNDHGTVTLFIATLSPLPLTPFIVFAALAGLSPLNLGLSVWLARWIKYTVVVWLLLHAPRLIKKVFKDFPIPDQGPTT